MGSLFFFESMLTPKIITIIYWLMLVGAVVSGVSIMFGGYGGATIGKFFYGIASIVGGAVAARVSCELMIVLFKMNESLADIKSK